MPPERFPPDDPREWLQRAHSNLIQAGAEQEGIYVEARYPGLDEVVDREEYLEALALAEAVIRWVEESIA